MNHPARRVTPDDDPCTAAAIMGRDERSGIDVDLGDRLRRWRHDLHEIPELGLAEHLTGDYLAARLEALGLEVTRGIGGTGLVASLRRGAGGSVALRADMDGLQLDERAGGPPRSRHPGVMHACGHDGHMAMVLGAGLVLSTEGGFAGTVHLVFQPAEEPGLGARAMIADGLFHRFPIDWIFGLHNMPGRQLGTIGTRAGPIMAAEDNFEIRIIGRGGHAARPQMVIDPIVVGAEIVLALQTVVARNVDPAAPAVVSCTEIVTDGARNAIPGEVVIRGDTRAFSPSVRTLLERRMRELCDGICAAHGARYEIRYTHEFEPTVNDGAAVDLAVRAARKSLSGERVDPEVPPWTASEDFGVFLERVPGCMALLGNGEHIDAGGAPLHSPEYRFDDDALEVGVAYYVDVVRTALPES